MSRYQSAIAHPIKPQWLARITATESKRRDFTAGKPRFRLREALAINLDGNPSVRCPSNAAIDFSCRWPLALRFIKGAIHGAIILPVVLHAGFAALIAFIDQNMDQNLGLPNSAV